MDRKTATLGALGFVALAALNGVAIRDAHKARRELANLRADIAQSEVEASGSIVSLGQQLGQRLDAIDKRIDKTDQKIDNRKEVAIVPGLTYIPISGRNIKAVRDPVKPGAEVAIPLGLRRDKDWTPSSPIDLPFPWPERYKQPFKPYSFALNALAMAGQVKAGTLPSNSSNLDTLLKSLERYSDDVGGGALATRYDFENPMYDGVLPAGWHSSLGNGFVIIGLLELAEATGNAELTKLAGRYVDALRWSGKDSDIVMVDKSDFLWFEEVPPLNGKPVHITNGHICTVLALYRYWQSTGDETMLPLIRAGLATAARYLPDSRRPGQAAAAYSLYDTTVADYGPLRMVNFARTMQKMSDNPAFKGIEDMLLTDTSVNVDGFPDLPKPIVDTSSLN